MANSADSDHLASSEANWSGSTLFAKTGHVVFSKRRVKFVTAFIFDWLMHSFQQASRLVTIYCHDLGPVVQS